MRGDAQADGRPTDLTAASAALTLQVSRERLELEHIETIRMHDGGAPLSIQDRIDLALRPGGLLEGLRELRSRGEIRRVSLGMCVLPEPHESDGTQILDLIGRAPEGTFDS